MKYTKSLWVVVGIATALMLGGLSTLVLSCLEQQRRHEAREVAHGFSARLLERFNETLGALYLIAASVDRQSGTISRFDEHSADLMRDFPLLRALELAPGGVISRVYPLRGNESIIGHDLLTDKTRNREVHLAVSRRQLAIAGPFELTQGGVGIVARYPLYQTSADGRSRFWGLSIAVIDVPSLLRIAGESEFDDLDYRYQICWMPQGEDACRLAIGDQNLSPENAVVSKFAIGQAEWRLMVLPRQGWVRSGEYGLAALIAALGALVGWLGYYVVRRRSSGRLASPAT
jgi:sensor domain CHASE-containing protein